MLFNSFAFLLFLPPVLLLYVRLGHRGRLQQTLSALALCSLLFYGFWNPAYLLLLLGSVGFNYLLALQIWREVARRGEAERLWLLLGVAGNLGLLGYFKYTGLLVDAVNLLAGLSLPAPDIVLPLAISFFTFQQIAFLADARQGKVNSVGPVEYLLFVSFFPQLIAGPIVHHAEMMPQFRQDISARDRRADYQLGLSLFVIGLAKKVLLADNLAPVADVAFAAAEAGEPLPWIIAAMGVAAFTLQIYFDFSGYSDMALGLARLFGIRLPANFYSPYRARSIIEFWRLWHITLSRFLRDYLYIPLGGNRRGRGRRYLNLLLTMLLGGLWHGASVNFVLWGGAHGLMLCLNHAWRWGLARLGLSRFACGQAYAFSAWLLTLAGVSLSWIWFRAETLAGAAHMLEGLVSPSLGPAGVAAAYTGRIGDGHLLLHSLLPEPLGVGALWRLALGVDIGLLTLGAAICVMLPNALQLTAAYQPTVGSPPDASLAPVLRFRWQPTPLWGTLLAVLFLLSVLSFARVTPFLYFQF